jgi:hypothetical protein
MFKLMMCVGRRVKRAARPAGRKYLNVMARVFVLRSAVQLRRSLLQNSTSIPQRCNFQATVVVHFDNRHAVLTLRSVVVRLSLKCDGTCAETRFRLSAQRMNPFKSAGASVQSTTGSRRVRISSFIVYRQLRTAAF